MDVVGSWNHREMKIIIQKLKKYMHSVRTVYLYRQVHKKLVPVSFPYSRFEPETETGDVYEILIYALAEGKQTLYTKKYYLKVKPGGRDMLPYYFW